MMAIDHFEDDKGKARMDQMGDLGMMDVDAPSAPRVGAHLPWVEKYRPAGLEEVVSHHDIIATCTLDFNPLIWCLIMSFQVKRFVHEGKLPHLMFYGPPGTGKTSTAVALVNTIYGPNHSGKVLELNASDERGIDVVREQIKSFAATRNLAFGRQEDDSSFKLIILDESDAMTSTAQNALRRVMEKYVKHVRFILMCNYASQLIPAIQSRCTRFRFAPIGREAALERLEAVIKAEGLNVSSGAKAALVELSKGDMRRVLNVLQAAASTLESTGELIGEELVYAVTATPHPSELGRILECLLNSTSFAVSLGTLRRIQAEHAIALQDIVAALFERVNGLKLPAPMRVYLTQQLAELEYRLTIGTSEGIQLASLVGIFLLARELA
jgi:replication factor C subunit 3/5